jgi:hypothetical protein
MNFKSKSQAYQDRFAALVAKKKTYIEIGAYKPVHKNNTFNLETALNWKGFSIELNQKWKTLWEECTERRNKIFWESALDFDYQNALRELNLPNRIGYLSCDIEPPSNTFAALKRVIEQGVIFDCITFEHDNYVEKKSDQLDYDIVAREYLASKGYKTAVTGVYNKDPKYEFETWFVHGDIEFETMTYDQWKKSINVK